ncbi:MAG TPA: hypothetical protein VGM75_11750 [Pseudonocardiaceae bacterium]
MWRWWGHWPVWSAYAAGGWSLGYGALGLYWALGGNGFPFAHVAANRATGSILENAPVTVVAPTMAALGLLGGIAGILMPHGQGSGPVRRVLLVLGWASAAALALVIPDYSILGILALSPVLLVFAFTGVPGPQHDIGAILYWHRMNLVLMFLGGLLWAAATLAYQRRTRRACGNCGRRDTQGARWTTPEAARRWGRRAVLVACVANVPYEITRIAWYFGYPLGITTDFHRMMANTPGMLSAGLGLAMAGIAGGILIHGLSSRWGEVYPRWIWFKAGKPVPPALAVVPASLVAVVLIPAGLMNFRIRLSSDMWAANVPATLWIVWGAALGAATYAYYLRRRLACRQCGRGDCQPAPGPAPRSATGERAEAPAHQ